MSKTKRIEFISTEKALSTRVLTIEIVLSPEDNKDFVLEELEEFFTGCSPVVLVKDQIVLGDFDEVFKIAQTHEVPK